MLTLVPKNSKKIQFLFTYLRIGSGMYSILVVWVDPRLLAAEGPAGTHQLLDLTLQLIWHIYYEDRT